MAIKTYYPPKRKEKVPRKTLVQAFMLVRRFVDGEILRVSADNGALAEKEEVLSALETAKDILQDLQDDITASKGNKKSRPIVAGDPRVPKNSQQAITSTPDSIVSDSIPFVKWLGSLETGTIFAHEKKLYVVTGVEDIPLGCLVTLTAATGLAPQPPAGVGGGQKDGQG